MGTKGLYGCRNGSIYRGDGSISEFRKRIQKGFRVTTMNDKDKKGDRKMQMVKNKTTKEDVIQAVEENGIEFIRIEFLDYSGITRGRTIRKDSLNSALEKGVNFSTAIMSFDVFDEYIPNPMYGAEDGDFFALPDPSTFAIVPYRKNTARLLCDLVDINGQPWL